MLPTMERSFRYFRNYCDFDVPIYEFEDVILSHPSRNIQSSNENFMTTATEKVKGFLSQKIIANCWFRKQSPPSGADIKIEEKNNPFVTDEVGKKSNETNKEPEKKDPQEENILFVPDSALLLYECMQRMKLRQKEAKEKKDKKDKGSEEDEEVEDEDEWKEGEDDCEGLSDQSLEFGSPESAMFLCRCMQKLFTVKTKKNKAGEEDETEVEDDEKVKTEGNVKESNKEDRQTHGTRVPFSSVIQQWRKLCKQVEEEEKKKYNKEDKKGEEFEKTNNNEEEEVNKDEKNAEKEKEVLEKAKEEGNEKEETVKEREKTDEEKRKELLEAERRHAELFWHATRWL